MENRPDQASPCSRPPNKNPRRCGRGGLYEVAVKKLSTFLSFGTERRFVTNLGGFSREILRGAQNDKKIVF
jgi:hypothetical protein